MSPLHHNRTTSSLVPPIFYVAKKIGSKKIEGSPFEEDSFGAGRHCIFCKL